VNPCEKLLGMARKLQSQGKPIPLDMLVEAERLGLSLSLLDQPKPTDHEGDDIHGTESTIPNT